MEEFFSSARLEIRIHRRRRHYSTTSLVHLHALLYFKGQNKERFRWNEVALLSESVLAVGTIPIPSRISFKSLRYKKSSSFQEQQYHNPHYLTFVQEDMGATPSVPEKSIHQFTVKNSRGQDVDLSIYKGKVLLLVNVASKCGFTNSNYTQLTDLYNKYRDKGLEILAFPCNQFLKQEPGSSEEAQEFACTRFKAEYPIFQKVRVNGPETAPIYKFLKANKPGFMGSRIKWNFTKFLVDKEGQVIDRYSPTTAPLSIEMDIKKALGEI